MSDYPYPLVGGDPTLDFLNTIHDWTAAEPVDRLEEWDDAAAFGVAAGVVTLAEGKRLAAQPRGVEELDRLRELRRRLERIVGALVEKSAPAPADLDRLARDAAGTAEVAALEWGKGRFTRRVEAGRAGSRLLRWRLVDAALALLLSSRVERLKRCPRCGWFFLDTSKNGSRRWCSMAMCGSATKARSYYQRQKRSTRKRRRPSGR